MMDNPQRIIIQHSLIFMFALFEFVSRLFIYLILSRFPVSHDHPFIFSFTFSSRCFPTFCSSAKVFISIVTNVISGFASLVITSDRKKN